MPIPAILVGAVVGAGIAGALGPIMEPATLKLSQTIWPLVPIKTMDPGTLVVARIKGHIGDDFYKNQMAKQGFSGSISDTFIDAGEQILGPGDLLSMLVRGIITPQRFNEELLRLGISSKSATDLEGLAETLLGSGDLLGLLTRGVISPDEFTSKVTQLGVSSENASSLVEMAENILGPEILVRAKFRGEIDEGRYNAEMTRLGFTPESAANFEATAKIIGGPSDMIRWAVREVFTPEIVRELGLADEFPSEFVAQAAKIGMDEEIASNEWAAHWTLPSIQQGFEMLHRKVQKRDGSTFEISDMERLLRVQDVMPFFRGLITQIAFRPFTRVDVRRMHKMGILAQEEVQLAYEDLGFNTVKAKAMTAFTIQFNTESERDLTKSEIMRAFARRVLDEESVLELLGDVGIPIEAAQIIVATQLAKEEMDLTDEKVDVEVDRFVAGIISEQELEDAVGLLELSATQLAIILAKAERKRLRAQKFPPKGDILKFLRAELIDVETADGLLERLGFSPFFRDLYIQSVTASEEEFENG